MSRLTEIVRWNWQRGGCSREDCALLRLNLMGGIFLGLCALAMLRPLVMSAESPNQKMVARGFPGWTAFRELDGLVPLALSSREEKFARQFPGEIAAFAGDGCTWILRWAAQPTRKLHPAADCLRATGYDVHPEPIFVSDDGRHWGAILASRGDEQLLVRERIIDREGREFTDVSAWFWAAALEKSPGPWWCVTRIETVRSR